MSEASPTPEQAAKPESGDIESRVKKLVAEALAVEEAKITPESRFVEDLGADSLDTVELVMALEEEFDCDIPDEEVEKITSVGEAISSIRKKTAE